MKKLYKKGASIFDLIFSLGEITFLIMVIIGAYYLYNNVKDTQIFTDPSTSLNASTELRTNLGNTIPTFDYVPVAIFFSFVLGSISLAFFLQGNAMYYPINLLVAFTGWLLSIPISNFFETLQSDPVINGITSNLPITTFFTNKLPYLFFFWMMLFSIFLYFIKKSETEGSESGLE